MFSDEKIVLSKLDTLIRCFGRKNLVLDRYSPIPVTYAGGASRFSDLETVKKPGTKPGGSHHWQCPGYIRRRHRLPGGCRLAPKKFLTPEW